MINQAIFRAYDIRGIYPDEIDEKSAYQIGLAFAAYVKDSGTEQIITGCDARISSPVLSRSFIRGVTDAGINILNIGLAPVDMVYFASGSMHLPAAMITASHNPGEYNGFKLMRKDADLMGINSGLSDVKKLIEEKRPLKSKKGLVVEKSIKNDYIEHVLGFTEYDYIRPMRIAVDAGSGSVGPILGKILGKLSVNYTPLYFNPDGNFPYHEPDPKKEKNLSDLKNEVTTNHYHFGCAFDGDGDRLGMIDERGAIIWPDRYMILLSRLVLAKNPGAKVVFDVKVSEALIEDITAHGGIPIMCKTGHSYIKAKMIEEEAALAGEMSGHIFFRDNFYGFDDAFFAALKILEYLSAEDKPLSQIVASTPYYISTPTIQVQTTDEDKYGIVEKLTEEFKGEGYRVTDINGARVYIGDGWGLVRASSNTPTLVLRFEAKTQEGLNNIQKNFRDKLQRFPSVNKNWDTSGM